MAPTGPSGITIRMHACAVGTRTSFNAMKRNENQSQKSDFFLFLVQNRLWNSAQFPTVVGGHLSILFIFQNFCFFSAKLLRRSSRICIDLECHTKTFAFLFLLVLHKMSSVHALLMWRMHVESAQFLPFLAAVEQ